jgi:hypothetical protein
LEYLDVDRQIDQGVEGPNGADIACFGSFDAQILGLTVDTFAGRTLVVDDVIEGTLAIQGDAHQPPSFLVDVLDTAFLFAKLLVVAGLLRRLRKEQRTAIALRAIAIGMLELVRGVHAQAARTEGGAIRIAFVDGMRMLVERNGGHPGTCGTGLVDVPGVIGSISGDMDGKSREHGHGLDVQRREVGHIAFIEGQGEVSQHDIPVDGIGGCRHARAVAPDVFLFFFGGAIGLHLIGTRFDAQPAIGVVLGLLVILSAFRNIGTKVVLFDVGVEVLDIVGDDFAQARNFLLQGLHALLEQGAQQTWIE